MQLNNNAQWFMNFQNLKVALSPMYTDKSCVLSYFEKLIITKFYPAVFQLSVPKTVIKGGLVGHTVAMVIYYGTKMITTCSPMTGQFFDIIIVSSSDKEWL